MSVVTFKDHNEEKRFIDTKFVLTTKEDTISNGLCSLDVVLHNGKEVFFQFNMFEEMRELGAKILKEKQKGEK